MDAETAKLLESKKRPDYEHHLADPLQLFYDCGSGVHDPFDEANPDQTWYISTEVCNTCNTCISCISCVRCSSAFPRVEKGEIFEGASPHYMSHLNAPSSLRHAVKPLTSRPLAPAFFVCTQHPNNRLFSSLDLLVEVLCQGLNELTEDKERLGSMMSFPHLNVSI
jgi:hypothetical protein